MCEDIPYDLRFKGDDCKISQFFVSLDLSKHENYTIFESFVNKYKAQKIINNKNIEENNPSILEIFFLFNTLNNLKKDTEKNPSLPFGKNENYANHYSDNIFKEFLYDEKNTLIKDEESKNHMISETVCKHQNFKSFSQNSPQLKTNEANFKSFNLESQINNEAFLKMKKIFEKNQVQEFFLTDLKNGMNALFWIRNEFIKNFLKDFKNRRKLLSKLKEKNIDNLSQDFSKLIHDLNWFFRIYCESIVLFYNFDKFNIFSFVSQDEIYEFVVLICFDEHPNIFKFLYLYQQKIEKAAEHHIELNKKKCEGWKPEDFGISEKYSLNQTTINYFSNQACKKHSLDLTSTSKNEDPCLLFGNDQEIVYLSLLEDYPEKNEGIRDKIEESEEIEGLRSKEHEIIRIFKSSSAEIIKQTISITKTLYPQTKTKNFRIDYEFGKPYESALKKLNEIGVIKNPIYILTKITEVSFEIINCIRKFYQENEQNFEGYIECDEMMNIFIYLCVQSDSISLYSKSCLIQNFISHSKSSSIYGYYLTTLIASLSCLSDENFYSRIKSKQNNKYFINSLKKFSSNY